MVTIEDLLRAARAAGASDLHVSSGAPPMLRVHGVLQPMDRPSLLDDTTSGLMAGLLTSAQQAEFERDWELDFALAIEGAGRFRANVFRQRGSIAATFRCIPDVIPTLETLGLPDAIALMADLPRGLVLVTGATGSGKSTTLAALVDRINTRRPVHVLTIEDPVEFLHPRKRALVNQRELHLDTRGFPQALRAALREDPDVVLVGEMRDRETMEAALTLAETGHLTFATLHTSSAAQTVSRVVDGFPAHQQAQVRSQLSHVLQGVVCQVLLPRADGRGRVAAAEVLVATPAVRSLIRDDKVHQLASVMQAGQERHGMRTLNQSLARLVSTACVSVDAALAASSSPDDLRSMLERTGRMS